MTDEKKDAWAEYVDNSRIAQFIWWFIRLFSRKCDKCDHRYGYMKTVVTQVGRWTKITKECRYCDNVEEVTNYIE